MIVTVDDFDAIPFNLSSSVTTASSFEDYIVEQEELELRRILGSNLFEAFKAGLAIVTPAQKWVDLKAGKTYQYLGKTYRWYGMKKALVPFIFSKWLKDTTQFPTDVAVVEATVENGKSVGPAIKIVKGYNTYSSLVGEHCKVKDTLYGYLLNSEATYLSDLGDDYTSMLTYLRLNFKRPGKMNTFSI
jgi:hypothetical protein